MHKCLGFTTILRKHNLPKRNIPKTTISPKKKILVLAIISENGAYSGNFSYFLGIVGFAKMFYGELSFRGIVLASTL